LGSTVEHEATAALRDGSVALLEAGFHRHVAAESAAKGWDPRDAMIGLAPFIDCARRLGADPAMTLGPIARTGAAWYRETFDGFVVRSDVALEAFGWRIVDTPDGPAYRFSWPPDPASS
jgi:hypothetical protein